MNASMSERGLRSGGDQLCGVDRRCARASSGRDVARDRQGAQPSRQALPRHDRARDLRGDRNARFERRRRLAARRSGRLRARAGRSLPAAARPHRQQPLRLDGQHLRDRPHRHAVPGARHGRGAAHQRPRAHHRRCRRCWRTPPCRGARRRSACWSRCRRPICTAPRRSTAPACGTLRSISTATSCRATARCWSTTARDSPQEESDRQGAEMARRGMY